MTASVQPTQGLASRDRRALVGGGVAVVLLLSYAWGVKPWLATLAGRRAEVSQQADLLARERALVAGASQYPRTRAQLASAAGASRTRLIAGDSVTATATLASYVDDVATATGLHVTSVEGRAPSHADALMTVSVELRGDARFPTILAFLRTVESAGYLITVPSVRLERSVRDGQLSLTATLSGAAVEAP